MGTVPTHEGHSRETGRCSLKASNNGYTQSTMPPYRRLLSRGSSASPSPPLSRASASSLHTLNIFYPRSQSPATQEQVEETDAECWERMLALQMEYHCYKSARLEAAVEALESGLGIEDVPMPSRLCLDLLNEELRTQIEGQKESFYQ